MSKPAPRQSSAIRLFWRVINLIGLAIALFIPIVDDQTFGTINYLSILSVMLMFLPGVIFQAIAIPGKLPGLLLYVGGLISFVSLIIYLLLKGIRLVWLRKKGGNLRSLFLLTMSGIGVFAVLFLWQGHLTHGAAIVVAALISSFVLEFVELINC